MLGIGLGDPRNYFFNLFAGQAAREGHQGAHLVTMRGDVPVDRGLIFQGCRPAGGHHHCLGMPIKQVGHIGAVVLNDDLDLLGDIGRMQAHPSHEALRRGGLVNFISGRGFPIGFLCELECRLVGGVVAQHVEDEPFLDGLLHRVHVEGLWCSVSTGLTEHFEGLALGGGCKGIEGYVCGCGARSHLRSQHVLNGQFCALADCFNFCLREDLAQLLRTCSGLRRVCFVCDDSEVLVCHSTLLRDRLENEGERLQGDDDDQLSTCQFLGEESGFGRFCCLADLIGIDRSDRPAGAFDRLDRLLQLVVKDCPVGDHDDRVEDLGIGVVVEVGQPMSQPGDGIGLP